MSNNPLVQPKDHSVSDQCNLKESIVIRVLITEKQTLLRKMLRDLLVNATDFNVVAEASNSTEVLEKLQHLEVDALILDMSMPGLPGLELITRAKAIRPELAILVLCKHSGTQFVSQSIKNGAHGYITTQRTPEEFLSALHKVAAGDRYIDATISENMLLKSITGEGEDEPLHTCLSQRELEIFRLLVSGKRVNQIAEQLVISNKTVSTHKMNLMSKMHFAGMADLMRYAVQSHLFEEHVVNFEIDPQRLRSAAEQQFDLGPSRDEDQRAADVILQELHIHQIELEMQNEQLRHAQIALEESRDRYVDLYELAPVGYLTLSHEGLLDEINLTGAKMLGDDRKKLLHRHFARHVVPADGDRWHVHFMRALLEGGKHSCELTLQQLDGTTFLARLDSQRSDRGEPSTLRMVLSEINLSESHLNNPLDSTPPPLLPSGEEI
jgi:PAS domain S-box-containing protein